ncbi:MAG: choice-of-anchor D domain-containing protein [Polyangiaceae bacterium]|nr:choice-of-anchor D domain-containing protein [Polyangiaceae bacterium]
MANPLVVLGVGALLVVSPFVAIVASAPSGITPVQLRGKQPRPAQLKIEPAELHFGAQAVDTTSKPQTFVLKNPGRVPVPIDTMAVSEGFEIESSCAPHKRIEANGSCPVQVTFRPTREGEYLGVATVTSSAVTAPLTVNLSGKGEGNGRTIKISLDPASLTLRPVPRGSNAASTGTVTIGNDTTSTGPLVISSIVLTANDAAAFKQESNCVNSPIKPGGSCEITVAYTPRSREPQAGELVILSNADNPSVTVPVVGNP